MKRTDVARLPGSTHLAVLLSIVLANDALAGEPSLLSRIDAQLDDFIHAKEITGAVTLFAHRGKVQHVAAIGTADVNSERKMTTDTIFRIASMTKPITATALMILQDKGKLSVDDPH